MRVQVDEAGRQDEAGGIDCPARRAVNPANLDDAPAVHGDVAAPSRGTGAVANVRPTDDYIAHRSLLAS